MCVFKHSLSYWEWGQNCWEGIHETNKWTQTMIISLFYFFFDEFFFFCNRCYLHQAIITWYQPSGVMDIIKRKKNLCWGSNVIHDLGHQLINNEWHPLSYFREIVAVHYRDKKICWIYFIFTSICFTALIFELAKNNTTTTMDKIFGLKGLYPSDIVTNQLQNWKKKINYPPPCANTGCHLEDIVEWPEDSLFISYYTKV